MAEGWAKHLKMDLIDAYSAGVSPKPLDSRAVQVMAEAGVDISNHRSKHLDELKNIQFDFVFTVCDSAHESCPVFPGKTKVIHVGFDDPPRLAKETKTEEDALNIYRRVRDEIKTFVEKLPGDILSRKENSTLGKIELEIYYLPMCCSSSVFRSGVDPELVRFSSYSEWLKTQLNVEVVPIRPFSLPCRICQSPISQKRT